MLKYINILAILLFVLMTTVTPYRNALQNIGEISYSVNDCEEKICHQAEAPQVYIPHSVKFVFPRILDLQPQFVVLDVLKPPHS